MNFSSKTLLKFCCNGNSLYYQTNRTKIRNKHSKTTQLVCLNGFGMPNWHFKRQFVVETSVLFSGPNVRRFQYKYHSIVLTCLYAISISPKKVYAFGRPEMALSVKTIPYLSPYTIIGATIPDHINSLKPLSKGKLLAQQ